MWKWASEATAGLPYLRRQYIVQHRKQETLTMLEFINMLQNVFYIYSFIYTIHSPITFIQVQFHGNSQLYTAQNLSFMNFMQKTAKVIVDNNSSN